MEVRFGGLDSFDKCIAHTTAVAWLFWKWYICIPFDILVSNIELVALLAFPEEKE